MTHQTIAGARRDWELEGAAARAAAHAAYVAAYDTAFAVHAAAIKAAGDAILALRAADDAMSPYAIGEQRPPEPGR